MPINVAAAPTITTSAYASYAGAQGQSRNKFKIGQLQAEDRRREVGIRQDFQREMQENVFDENYFRDEEKFQRELDLWDHKTDSEKVQLKARRTEYESQRKQVEDAKDQLTPDQFNTAMADVNKRFGEVATPYFARVQKESQKPPMWTAPNGSQMPMPMKDGKPQPFEASKEYYKREQAAWKMAIDASKNADTGLADMDKAQEMVDRLMGTKAAKADASQADSASETTPGPAEPATVSKPPTKEERESLYADESAMWRKERQLGKDVRTGKLTREQAMKVAEGHQEEIAEFDRRRLKMFGENTFIDDLPEGQQKRYSLKQQAENEAQGAKNQWASRWMVGSPLRKDVTRWGERNQIRGTGWALGERGKKEAQGNADSIQGDYPGWLVELVKNEDGDYEVYVTPTDGPVDEKALARVAEKETALDKTIEERLAQCRKTTENESDEDDGNAYKEFIRWENNEYKAMADKLAKEREAVVGKEPEATPTPDAAPTPKQEAEQAAERDAAFDKLLESIEGETFAEILSEADKANLTSAQRNRLAIAKKRAQKIAGGR